MPHGTNGHFPWESGKKMKAAAYYRDLDTPTFQAYEEKFSGLLRMCEEAKKGEVEIVVVAKPEVLGDNYEEVVESLRRCAKAGLLIAIAGKKAG
jgi:DNA invertase Pin-like site-specific DNA recombinase